MLIIKMILKITDMTQEELANFLGVSRATINYWLKGEKMSLLSKQIISEKFSFPISYFDRDTNENIEVYRIMFSTIQNNYKKNYSSKLSEEDKINEILNKIELEEKTYNEKIIDETDIIDGLLNGYNPYNGELFGDNHILCKCEVKRIIEKLYNSYCYTKNNVYYNNYNKSSTHERRDYSHNELTDKELEKYNKLKKWRTKKSNSDAIKPYMIFSNQVLINIIKTNIKEKEDLLKVKGIRQSKFDSYGDDVFNVLMEKAYE